MQVRKSQNLHLILGLCIVISNQSHFVFIDDYGRKKSIIDTLHCSYLHTFWTMCVNGIFDQLPIGKIKYYNIIHSNRNSLWQSFFSADLKKIC